MLAENGKTYAQIDGGICRWIFTKEQLPEWNETDFKAVDITGKTVEIGYLYNADGTFSAPSAIELDLSAIAENVRNLRNTLLAKTDWTQLADVPQVTKDLWAPYRQALRDITSQEGFPENVIWPAKPTA